MNSSAPQSAEIRNKLLFVFGTLLYFFANFQRVVIPGAIFNELQSELSASAPAITGLGSAFMYTYAVSQLVVGLLITRYGGKRVIAWGTVLICLGSLMFPCSHGLFMMYVSRVVVSMGCSTIYLSMVAETVAIAPISYPIVLGVVYLVGYLGSCMANAPVTACLNYTDWRTLLKFVALACGVISLCFWATYITLPKRMTQKASFDISLLFSFIKRRQNRVVLGISCLVFSIYYVMQAILGKKFLQDFYQIDSLHASWVLTAMSVVAAVTNISCAVLSRCCGNRRKVFMVFAGTCVVVSTLLLTSSIAFGWLSPWFSICFLTITVSASFSTITIALIKEFNPPELLSIATSFNNFSAYMAVAILGNLSGHLMNLFPPRQEGDLLIYGRNSYLAVLSVMLFISLIVLVNSLRLRETYGKDCSNQTD
jgi:predicted MFS family arabinose efflux permease